MRDPGNECLRTRTQLSNVILNALNIVVLWADWFVTSPYMSQKGILSPARSRNFDFSWKDEVLSLGEKINSMVVSDQQQIPVMSSLQRSSAAVWNL